MAKPKRRTPQGRSKERAKAGRTNNYKHSMKGHTWTGHGKERVCKLCGIKPRQNR